MPFFDTDFDASAMENWANPEHKDFYELESADVPGDSDDADDITDILNWSTGAQASTGYKLSGEDEDRFVFALQTSGTSPASTAAGGAQPAPDKPVFEPVSRATSYSVSATVG